MPGLFSFSYQRWKSHSRRYDLLFLIGTPVRRYLDKRQADRDRQQLLLPPIDTLHVEVLVDEEFRASVAEIAGRTLLDAARLANLWCLARQAGPGVYLEIGSYRGGGALHICNAVRSRNPQFYSFDPFEEGGFRSIREDEGFTKDQFTETSHRDVVKLLSRYANATVIRGYFPEAAQSLSLQGISFCHLDVDVYQATLDSLNFLAPRLGPKSFIVIDDMNRKVSGVNLAVKDFLAEHPSFLLIPMFPSQGVLLSTELW
jgi:O-methyltransferase